MSCDARLYLAAPHLTEAGVAMVAACDSALQIAQPARAAWTEHSGYLVGDDHLTYDGDPIPTRFTWYEGDRRNYHGDLVPEVCAETEGPFGDGGPDRFGVGPCVLPAGHPGRHAT